MSTHDVFGPGDKYRLEEREAPFHIVYEDKEDTAEEKQKKEHRGKKYKEREELKYAIDWKRVVDEHMRKREEEMRELGNAYEYPKKEEDKSVEEPGMSPYDVFGRRKSTSGRSITRRILEKKSKSSKSSSIGRRIRSSANEMFD